MRQKKTWLNQTLPQKMKAKKERKKKSNTPTDQIAENSLQTFSQENNLNFQKKSGFRVLTCFTHKRRRKIQNPIQKSLSTDLGI